LNIIIGIQILNIQILSHYISEVKITKQTS